MFCINTKREGGTKHTYKKKSHIYHIDAAVLAVVDLVVAHDGAAVGPDLDSRQGVAVDVVALD